MPGRLADPHALAVASLLRIQELQIHIAQHLSLENTQNSPQRPARIQKTVLFFEEKEKLVFRRQKVYVMENTVFFMIWAPKEVYVMVFQNRHGKSLCNRKITEKKAIT